MRPAKLLRKLTDMNQEKGLDLYFFVFLFTSMAPNPQKKTTGLLTWQVRAQFISRVNGLTSFGKNMMLDWKMIWHGRLHCTTWHFSET